MTELREMDEDGSSKRKPPVRDDVKKLKFKPKVPPQKPMKLIAQKPQQEDPKPIDEELMKIMRTRRVAAKSAPNTQDECSPQKTLSMPPSADVVQLGVQKQNQLPLQIPRSFPVPVNSGMIYEEESDDDDDDNDSDDVELLETQPDSIEREALTRPAEELDLLQQGSKERMFLFQFPKSLPLPKRSSSAGKEVMEGSNLQQLPQGYLGKMLVYKSGKIKMKLGDVTFDVSPGTESRMPQHAVALNTRDKHCSLLGEIENRHVIVTPDVDSLLNDK